MCNLSEKIKEEAEKNTEKRLNSLYKWLFDNGRSADVQKATTDSFYRETLLKEMREAMVASSIVDELYGTASNVKMTDEELRNMRLSRHASIH